MMGMVWTDIEIVRAFVRSEQSERINRDENIRKMLSELEMNRSSLIAANEENSELQRHVDILKHEDVWICKRIDIAKHWIKNYSK